ncbi:hypothetical protein LY56_03176 [Roseinatronobacter thiooxidans]|uniref:Plasmid recombination enzyme n=1 Tax=Roseinatronobacter thiooxidans TaxID=121821 RepID=A0A2W7QHB4_9RHOB|nr:hypothetical protein [Roseinatronobacter thiooxidans]PZX37975.1 hypothetical protein LY56_03176 [Roseinatronobacter thiooxidans]
MSIHARFDNPESSTCLTTAPIVLRFASLFPRDLKRREMHDKRTGGDLTHVRTDLSHLNTQPVGEPDWIERIHAEIAAAMAHNHEEEIAARERKGRFLEAERLRERGPVDPWKFTRGGPLREGIITVNKLWFGGTGHENWDPERVGAFKRRVNDFLQEHFPGGQLREVNIDEDEEALHFHFAIAVWVEKVSQNRGRQRLLQPSANPLLANYEHAQDIAGEAFVDMGIHRGERRAAAARAALAAGLEAPSPRKHVTPSKWREEQRRKALADRDRIRKKTWVEAAQVRADAGLTAKSTMKKSRKRAIREAQAQRQQADQIMVEAQIALKRGYLAEAFRRAHIKSLAEKTTELERRRSEQAARIREMETRALALHRENAQAAARAEAARQAQADAEAARIAEERRAKEAARTAGAHEARAADALARVDAVRNGLVALSEGVKARTLHEGGADDLKRMAEPVRAAHPEIAPAVAAAHSFLGSIDAVQRDTAALARSALTERTEAIKEIEQERSVARSDIAEQRAELAREKGALDEMKANLALKWAAADRLLRVLQPLIEKMTLWLRRAGLPAELADEGKDILRDAREVISTSKPEPKPEGEGPGT